MSSRAELPEGDGRASLEEIRDATTVCGRAREAPVAARPARGAAVRRGRRPRAREQDLGDGAPACDRAARDRDPRRGVLRALGSYDELHQVLLNLCLNAIDAMPKGGRLAIAARTIKIHSDEALARQLPGSGTYVELTVTDNGCGMDAATLARAFEPFFTTKSRDKGTGLGLAMIHSSVRRHHGAVDVQSVVGHGTTFRITLPVYSE